MKKANRTLALALTLSLLMTMASCGDTSETEKETTPTTTTSTVTTSTATTETSKQSETTTVEDSEPESEESTSSIMDTTSAEDSGSESIPEETPSDVESRIHGEITFDDLKPENAKNFKNFLNETELTGQFVDKADVTSQFYFLPNKSFYHEQTPSDNGKVVLMCTIDEAKPYSSDDLLSFYEADGVEFLIVREWTEDEWELYKLDRQENLEFQPYWTYEWEKDWNDLYIDDYVFVPD